MHTSIDRLASLPNRRPLLALVLVVLTCILVGASGSIFTVTSIESWYATLEQPDLAPPNWVFGPVWTVLFAVMGVAAWLVWRGVTGPNAKIARAALGLFAVQFGLNVAWSAVFFGSQSILGGLVVIVLLWFSILGTMVAFFAVDRRAGVMLVPYLAWVTFATYLNNAFWVLN